MLTEIGPQNTFINMIIINGSKNTEIKAFE